MAISDTSVETNAVIIAMNQGTPMVRTVTSDEGLSLPSGALESDDRTIQESIRRWVRAQTDLELGYVEQLYTFGDADRIDSDGRHLSIAYLALVYVDSAAFDDSWVSIYDLFPWEDGRTTESAKLRESLRTKLLSSLESESPEQQQLAKIVFPEQDSIFDGVRALERYELMYGAAMLAESGSVETLGIEMFSDHRRIAATALSRIRGKLTYRPVVFELLAHKFTLRELQSVVEGLSGKNLHTQNFRRLVEQGGLVSGTGETAESSGGGRPAELFSFRTEVLLERPRPGFK